LKNLIKVCRIDELEEGRGRKIKAGRYTIAVFRHNEKIYAFQNACPHQNADLADGYIRHEKLFCRLHHWAFDLKTGAYAFNSEMHLRTFPVVVEGGLVYLNIKL
jgi:nitrite reductase (NADH) small subunit